MMNHVGDGSISSNVGITNGVVNEFKDPNEGHDHADISMIADPAALVEQVDVGEGPPIDPLMLDKITTTRDANTALVPMRKRRKATKTKRSKRTKKPPDAPKRFKSSFIFFSMAKHKEIKDKIANGLIDTKGNINITNMVAEAWKTLDPLEREKFEEMARQDKARYDIEARNYVPPPGYAFESKRKRDPNAPKRPMSAYLSFANKIRGKIKKQNPGLSNGEISKILSGLWKDLPDAERNGYKTIEKNQWDDYREKMAEWKKINDGRKKEKKLEKLMNQKELKGIKNFKKKPDRGNLGSLDFAEVDNDGNVDDQLLGLGNVTGMDNNPNTDEMMAASALRGVRGGPQPHLMGGLLDSSQNNSYPSFLGVNVSNGMMNGPHGSGQQTFGQIDMQGYPYNQHNYSFGGNPHAMIMAQLRGGPQQQYTGFMQMDQQANLTQLASLAGVQNDVLQQQQQHQQSLDQSISSGSGMNIGNGLGNDNVGNGGVNDSPAGSAF